MEKYKNLVNKHLINKLNIKEDEDENDGDTVQQQQQQISKEFISIKDKIKNGLNNYKYVYNDFKHKLIVQDLVVTIEMTESEKEYYGQVEIRYLSSKEIFENERISMDEKKRQIKSILNEFEYQQFAQSPYNFYGQLSEKETVDKGSLEYLSENYSQFSLMSMGFDLQFLKSSLVKFNNRIPHLYKISLYDKSGNTFTVIRNMVKCNLIFSNMYFNSICLLNKSVYKDQETNLLYDINLKRKTKNNQTLISKIIIPQPNFIDKYSVICFEGNENQMVNKRIEYSSLDINKTILNFNLKYFEKTGKSFNGTAISPQPPQDEEEDQLKILFPLNKKEKKNKLLNPYQYKEIKISGGQKKIFNIPTLKNILFSVVREMISRDEGYLDGCIDRLPVSILNELIKSCKYDKTPNGWTSLQVFIKKFKQVESIELPRIDQIINCSNDHNSWWSFLYEKSIIQNIFHLPYNDVNILINVYENKQLFILKSWPFKNQFILNSDQSTNQHHNELGNPSICNYNSFLNSFNLESNFRLLNDSIGFNWSNTIVSGGFITMCLLLNSGNNNEFIKKQYQDSDIDIFYYSLEKEEILKKIKLFIGGLKEIDDWKNYSLSKTLTGSIVFSRHYPYRHIKFHLEPYVNIQHVLLCCDVNSSGFAFDGSTVYTIFNSIQSINYKCNFINENSWMLNGDIRYQSRLIKYYQRGFSMVSYDLKFFKHKHGTITDSYDQFDPHNNHSGLALLVSCQKNNDVVQFIKSSIIPLPYGPDINLNNFNELIGEHCLISRYQLINESYFDLIKSHPLQYPSNRKYTTLSSNMFPFLNVQPRFTLDT